MFPRPFRERSRLMRAAALTGVGALAAVTLAGCIKVEADVTVAPDATASGTFGFELQKDAAGFLGISDAETFSSQLESGELAEEDGLQSFQDCEASETETGYLYSCAFADETFTDPTGLWTIDKEDSTIVFRMANEGQGDEGMDLGLGDTSMGSISVDVTFPGAITSVSGDGVTQTSDTSASIQSSMTESFDVVIRSEDGASGLTPAMLAVVLVAAGVIALIIIVAVVLISRRRRPQQLELPAGDDQPPAIDPS